MVLKSQWVKKETKEEIRKYLETNENKNPTFQKSMSCSKNSSKGEVYRNTGLPEKRRKMWNKQPSTKEGNNRNQSWKKKKRETKKKAIKLWAGFLKR